MQSSLHCICKQVGAQLPQNLLLMKKLGEQVKAFREGRGWNSKQMAEAVGTSRQNIESLEASGNRIPKYLGKLAVVMGRQVDDLLAEAGLAPLAKARGKSPAGDAGPPDLRAAIPVVLDAIAAAPSRAELRLLLPMLVDTNALAYRMRFTELLVGPDDGPNLTADDRADAARLVAAAESASKVDLKPKRVRKS